MTHTQTHMDREAACHTTGTRKDTHTHTPTHPPTDTHIHAHTHTHTPEAFENIKFHDRRQRPSQRLYQRATGRVRENLQRWTHVSDVIRGPSKLYQTTKTNSTNQRHRPTNQTTHQPANKPTNQPTNQLTNHPTQPTHQPTKR